MSRLDDLPPDQRATLSLLLGQRKSYADVAALLGMPERAVHDRAHAALAVLAPAQARELTAEQRESIGNYLLGQQTGVAERLATRASLDSSAPGRAWAHAVAEQIAPLSSVPLAEIPAGAAASLPSADTGDASTVESPPASEGPAGPARAASRGKQPSSRLAGAFLLAGIVALVVVAVVLITGGGSGSSHTASTSESASTASTTPKSSGAAGATSTGGATGSTSTGTGPTEVKRLTLTSPEPGSKAVGAVEILSEGSKHAFYLAAEHLPPSSGFFYAVWLYNSPSSHEAVSKSPPVTSSGTLQGGALLPANAGDYHTMLLTRETTSRPSHPGPIVLSGPFSLG
jgi:Sigma-70, region 4